MKQRKQRIRDANRKIPCPNSEERGNDDTALKNHQNRGLASDTPPTQNNISSHFTDDSGLEETQESATPNETTKTVKFAGPGTPLETIPQEQSEVEFSSRSHLSRSQRSESSSRRMFHNVPKMISKMQITMGEIKDVLVKGDKGEGGKLLGIESRNESSAFSTTILSVNFNQQGQEEGVENLSATPTQQDPVVDVDTEPGERVVPMQD